MCSFIRTHYHYLLSGLRGLNRRGAHPGAAPSARGFFGDQSGIVVVLVALAMPVLLGLTAFAVDVSKWSSTKNSIQAAADNSVLSAVMSAAQAGATLAQIQNQAFAVAAATGFTNGQNGVTVTVNTPPKSGNYTASTYTNSAYEVIIKQAQTRYFAVLLGAAPTVSGRAVALVAGSPACLLALDKTASSAISMSGGASVGATNCTVAANSSSGTAVTGSGGASLTAANLNIVGSYSTSGGFTVAATIKTGAPATTDPYGCSGGTCLAVPSFSTSGCSPNPNLSGGHTGTINPGCYNGITVSGGAKLTMNAGTYVINGGGGINLSGGSTLTMGAGIYTINNGSFSLSGGNTASGSGISIVLTGTPATIGSVNISGGATLTLTPPASGPMQGVAFYKDRAAKPSGTDSFSGGASMLITGSLYLPTEQVTYSGGSSTGSTCLQLIADTVSFSGGSKFGTSCGSLIVPGLLPPAGSKGKPVE
jgi:Flp pilus assembly protein TadG